MYKVGNPKIVWTYSIPKYITLNIFIDCPSDKSVYIIDLNYNY